MPQPHSHPHRRRQSAIPPSTLSLMLEAMATRCAWRTTARGGRDGGRFSPRRAILLDIGMPRMNGYDACRDIRAQPSATRRTSSRSPAGASRKTASGREARASIRHLVKPVEPALLEQLIRDCPVARARLPHNAGLPAHDS
jgi:CheY-like chemotaxis protein